MAALVGHGVRYRAIAVAAGTTEERADPTHDLLAGSLHPTGGAEE